MTNAIRKSQALEELPGGRHRDRTFPSLLGLASSDPFVLVREDDGESRHSGEALKELSRRLINAQEEERRRIACELHDDLNQRMALLSIELDQLRQIENPLDIECGIDCLQKRLQEIFLNIQQISYRLHPSKLAQIGLARALASWCQELSTTRKLDVVFEQSGFPACLPDELTLAIFRIAQEALRNCMKHSNARSALVRLVKTAGAVRLSVADDGCGFEVNAMTMKKGLGFTSMRERLRAVDGEMTIRSTLCVGTLIEIQAPIVR